MCSGMKNTAYGFSRSAQMEMHMKHMKHRSIWKGGSMVQYEGGAWPLFRYEVFSAGLGSLASGSSQLNVAANDSHILSLSRFF